MIYSRYFLGCPRPYLIRAKEAKVAKSDLVTDSIRVIFAGDIFVWNVSKRPVFMRSTFTKDIYIDIKLFDINS